MNGSGTGKVDLMSGTLSLLAFRSSHLPWTFKVLLGAIKGREVQTTHESSQRRMTSPNSAAVIPAACEL